MKAKDTLTSAVKNAIDSRLLSVHTCLPALIVSFDPLTRTCSVQPALQRRLVNEPEPVNLPVIEDIPVQFPGSAEFAVTYELKKDDNVILIFSERSLETWLTKGGTVDPGKADTFSLSDAIVIPGIMPAPSVWPVPIESGCISIRNKLNTVLVKLSDTEIEMKNNTAFVKMSDTEIEIENSAGSAILKTSGQLDINSGNLTVEP